MKVVIFQYRLLHYRVRLFEELRAECERRGIHLEIVCGQASRRELTKRDEGSLPWAHRVVNVFFEVGGRDILWQPIPREVEDADLFVVMQESRIISNYWLLINRLFSKRKLAYWGHGRNFQSAAPSGFREKWKELLLKRVDWWFAYSKMTVDILNKAGYPSSKITSLENSIDTTGFKADLSSWSMEDVSKARFELGIDDGAPVGIYCGSLYPDKKLELLIDSSDWIRKHAPTFNLVVIGDGPSMLFMRQAAASRPWIHLLGVRKGVQKALYFRISDVMLNPGLVGLHIVDAFCSGLVLVTTATARHSPEVAYLRNGENGILTEESVEGYGNAVLDIISDAERLQSMKALAKSDGERYTLENMVLRFADGIESALNA
jgi:L-malate glycosyltransferase